MNKIKLIKVVFSTLIVFTLLAFIMNTSLLLKLNLIKERQPKIFCLILTSVASYKIKAKTIYNTWASKCTNYRFVSKIPIDDDSIQFQDKTISKNNLLILNKILNKKSFYKF